jgi:Domain of unknown function (DUF4352)
MLLVQWYCHHRVACHICLLSGALLLKGISDQQKSSRKEKNMGVFLESLSKSPGPVLMIIGVLCFLLGSIGKVPGKIYDGKIVELNKWVRWCVALFGLVIVFCGFLIYAASVAASVSDTPQPPGPPSPQPSAPPSVEHKWDIVLNSSTSTSTYNGYTAPDGEHYIIVDVSMDNATSEDQVLSGHLFDLQDSADQHYTEDQASNPDQFFDVAPGKSIETQTAFLVPDSQCTFALSFIAGSNDITHWSITAC